MCRFVGRFVLLGCLLLAGCNLTDAGTTPVVPPDIPEVDILFPENGQQVVEGFDLTIDVFAQDDTSGVARIDVFVDGELLQSASVEGDEPVHSQFRIETNWIASGVGRHPISAIAYRLDNTPSNETIIAIEVVPASDEGGASENTGS